MRSFSVRLCTTAASSETVGVIGRRVAPQPSTMASKPKAGKEPSPATSVGDTMESIARDVGKITAETVGAASAAAGAVAGTIGEAVDGTTAAVNVAARGVGNSVNQSVDGVRKLTTELFEGTANVIEAAGSGFKDGRKGKQ